MKPTKAVYTMEAWEGREPTNQPPTSTARPEKPTKYELRVLPPGAALRFSVEHGEEGNLKLTTNEGEQLMKSLMHYFNIEVQ